MWWKCSLHGHPYEALVYNRTVNGSGCPYCENKKLWIGFNDLKTKFPEIAKEAYGWDPSKYMPYQIDKERRAMKWKCKKGHIYKTSITNRTYHNSECGYCTNRKVLKGFNDLKTLFPEIAKESDGWDPSKVLAGTHDKFSWKCSTCNYRWDAKVKERTGRHKTGCKVCAKSTYIPEKPAWFYLMKREGEQQFGITNHIEDRINFHSRQGWKELKRTGPHDGYKVQETEKILKYG